MNYTSVEQSKKLLELGISPETADMAWIDRLKIVTDCPEVPVIMDIELESMIPQNKLIPCWSLAALLDVLPEGTRLLKSSTGVTYHCDCPKGNIDKWYDNPIDVCYKIIIKLHEFKMLWYES